jgi:hypothetical protein
MLLILVIAKHLHDVSNQPSLAPNLHQCLAHDVDGIARPIVGRDTALGMAEDLHGEVLKAPRVAQLVLHGVSQ